MKSVRGHLCYNARINILHVYSGNLYGGVEAMLSTLARCRRLRPSLRGDYALCFEGRLCRELKEAGAAVHLLHPVRMSRPWTLWRARLRLRELLQAGNYDAVICHLTWTQALLGPEVRAARLPSVFWMHSPAGRRHWTDILARWTPPDLGICNGGFTRRNFAELYPGVNSAVVYGPVELPDLDRLRSERLAVRSELKTAPEEIVVIQVSRLDPWKGQEAHLQALGLLRGRPSWTCWLVGGPQAPFQTRFLAHLRETAERLGISQRVRFLGERADVPRLLAAADIFCQPATGDDAMPRTLAEAFLAELPVVATPLGGVPEIMDDTCGLLVPPGEPSRLASALSRLMDSEDLRRRLGSSGRRKALSQFDPANLLKRLESALGMVLIEN